jgi:hypothetical protein
VGERQKACSRKACKKARKQLAQRNWCQKNPGYFQGRYPEVKQWRQKRRACNPEVIQDKSRPSKPLLKLVLLIPGMKEDMIQDEIRLRRLEGRTFVADG